MPGLLSPQKGLGVVAACAADARARALPCVFHVLGATTEPLPRVPEAPVLVHGEYEEADFAWLLAALRPDVLFFPAQVPETWSYTLSAAITTGVPIVASDLGAFGERLAAHPQATLLRWDAPPAEWNAALLRAAAGSLATLPASTTDTETGASAPAQYRAHYLAPLPTIKQRAAEAGRTTETDHAIRGTRAARSREYSLAELYVAGVECGQAEARAELGRRLGALGAVSGLAPPASADAVRAGVLQRRASRRDRRSSGWRPLLPITARAMRAWGILRDQGPVALYRVVRAKLAREHGFRMRTGPRARVATAISPLSLPAAEGRPRATIVIPVFGEALLTFSCLRSVAAHTPPGRYEVVVVDDASPQPSAEVLHAVSGVRFVRNEANLGFIGSCNRGAELAQGEFLIFLNNDALVGPGWFDALLDTFAQRADAGLVGAKLVYPDGRLQEAGGRVARDGGALNVGRGDDADRPEYNYLRAVDYCSGACLAITADLFRTLGGFDTRYAPAYYEDTDLAFAVRAAGRKVYYQPLATIVHFEGRTAGTDPSVGVKRYQVVNRGKFADKWRDTLAAHPAELQSAPPLAGSTGRRVLVIDARIPTPDQDSGSLRMRSMLDLLLDLDCSVTFAADRLEYRLPYSRDLQQRGVEVLYHPYPKSVPALLAERGSGFDIVVLSRHHVAAAHLAAVRKFAPQALLVFDTVDLHFLREARAATLAGGALAQAAAETRRDSELAVVEQADLTLVVSPVERALLAELAPSARVAIVSNIHELQPGGMTHPERAGLLFIGGFQHAPNVDAVLWYAAEVLPLLRARLPGVTTTIVGGDAPAAIRALSAPDFVVTGHVSDVAPWFARARVSIAPLRYGAGVKGKINLAMSHGVPVVATTLAIEGMQLTPGNDVLVADDAAAFADAVARAYGDEALWRRLAAGGRENVRRHFSRDAARAALAAMLELAPRKDAD